MHRVVITGYGAVSAIGNTAEDSWQAALKGVSGLGPITQFDASGLPVNVACEVKDLNPDGILDRKEIRRQDRYESLAMLATHEAIEHSGLDVPDERKDRVGVLVSSASGGFISFREEIENIQQNGARRIGPFTIPKIMANGAAGLVSIKYGFRGPALAVASACATGADALGIALMMLRSGMIDVVVAGGAEASIHELGIGAFIRVQAYTEKGSATPTPFSKDRDGMVMGEGAGVLILETLEHARARSAMIYGELAGYAATADAYHITAPTEDGSGSGAAIAKALDDARVNRDEVDYISAHGTGTILNDAAETKAIKYALGDAAYSTPISSTKSMTGHMMGATGALEVIFCLQAINDGIVPPTINYHEADPDCDLDYVPNKAREQKTDIAISNAFGFGGHNSVLVMRRFDD